MVHMSRLRLAIRLDCVSYLRKIVTCVAFRKRFWFGRRLVGVDNIFLTGSVFTAFTRLLRTAGTVFTAFTRPLGTHVPFMRSILHRIHYVGCALDRFQPSMYIATVHSHYNPL